MKKFTLPLIIILALLLPAVAVAKPCKFNASSVASLQVKADAWTFAPSTKRKAAQQMPRLLVKKMLTQSWIGFGYSEEKARFNANQNLKQIDLDSSFYPYILQRSNDVNSGGNQALGLFQLIPSTFKAWAVNGYDDKRNNPLHNIVATVNAQVNARTIATTQGTVKVLAGQGGWGPVGGTNSCD